MIQSKLMQFPFIFFIAILWAQKPNQSASDFSGTALDGKVVQLSDFKGKVVLLDFWASWCGPCKQEMPFLVDLHLQNQKRGFVVLAVNIDKDAKNRDKFLSGLGKKPEFPILSDPESKICPLYGLEGMPTSVFIDKKGTIRFRHVGFKDKTKNQLIKEMETLIGEN